MSTQRSDEALAYRKFYDSPEWRALREWHLRREPLCRYCRRQHLVTAGRNVDHINPWKGDITLALDPNNLQTLCDAHHSSTKQSLERTGHERGCDDDGIPHDAASHWREEG